MKRPVPVYEFSIKEHTTRSETVIEMEPPNDEELSERSTFDQSSDLIYFSAEEDMRETKSNSTSVMKRMSGVRKSLLSATESKSEVPKLSSSGSENQKPADQKVHRKTNITKAATTNIETSAQNSIRKETKIGSFVFSDSSSDGSFVEFRKGCQPSKTISASQNEEKNLMKKLLTQMVAPKPEPTTVTSESDQSKAVAMQNRASDLILAKAIKNKITDTSPVCTPRNDVNAYVPEHVMDTVKPTSVAAGQLELFVKDFVEWSFLSHDDLRHICVNNSYNIRGYSFHIEINSNPLTGYPGQTNDNFAPAYRKCGILLVCDDAFPDPTLRLASNFVITLKARSSSFNDHIINCTTVFSAQNKTGGSLAVSEADRWEDMAQVMRKVVKLCYAQKKDRSAEERSFLLDAYNHLIESRMNSWRRLRSAENHLLVSLPSGDVSADLDPKAKDDTKLLNEEIFEVRKERRDVEWEIREICEAMIVSISNHNL